MWSVVIFLAGAICLRMTFRDIDKEAAARRRHKNVAVRNSVRHVDARRSSNRHMDSQHSNVQSVKGPAVPSGRPNRARPIRVVENDYGVRRVPATRQPVKRNAGYCATGSTVTVRCCQR